MPPIDAALTNCPVWFDLSTSDLDAAKTLYSDLFGWTYQDSGPEMGHYTMAFSNGRAAAAIAPKMPGQESAPVVWTTYFGVSDAAATSERITDAGGSMMFEPMQVGDVGHMAIAMDPDGAAFGLWQAGTFSGAGVEGEHGAMAWCEVNSKDAVANAAFYARVFDLTSQKLEMPGPTYFTLHQGEPAVAGVLQMDEHWAGILPHWMPYFAVAQLADADACVTKHGGKLLHGPIDSPYGRIMVVQDAQGAIFSYISEA